MNKQITLFADTNGSITADDQANASTVALRDAYGDLNANSVFASSLFAGQGAGLGAAPTMTAVGAIGVFSGVIVPCDGSAGAFAPTLPPVASCYNRILIIKRVGSAGNITITPNGSETIDGAANYVLSAQWSCVWLYAWSPSGGTLQWLVLAKF